MLVPCIGEDYMAGWHLDTKMAQDIVARTMRIIDTNINVMDARGGLSAAAIGKELVNCTKARCWCFLRGGWWISTMRSLAICTACVRGSTCRYASKVKSSG
ncbi:sugar diacid utilization regulator SdaR [Klebsiella variicola]|uniref:Sugar diacid utilization regulator SdaR n=1 Tax=Klebsiella variicola TaxID=244366 RepID=A0A7H4MDN6_KLEVA|nr:sugar diacid utilization regulator SdaR [Klebsiella variicola]